jgi:selenocysteine-specific elongation factor
MQKHIILGTAGHIDHGKTSLIRALSGVDTDRLPEEKKRGITIELGFTHFELPDGLQIGVVDVPGHEKFVHHMVAGVGGMDLIMLVVAADEGIMPQTKEHLSVCRLLGIQRGLIALTKVDMVDNEWLELVQEDIHEYLSGTFLENAPVIPVSSVTGTGLTTLRDILTRIAETVQPRPSNGVFRLPIDRVFTMRGFGTVVTGTVTSGHLTNGESLEITPGNRLCRVRGLQVHGSQADQIEAGQRAAVNLQNIDKDTVHRGMILTRPDTIPETKLIDAECFLLESVNKPLKNRTPIRFHSGTAEIIGRLILVDREQLLPGETGFVQIRLTEPTALLPLDRYVIRSYSPMITIGGGRVLDSEPSRHKRMKQESIDYFKGLASNKPQDRLMTILESAGTDGMPARILARRTHPVETSFDTIVSKLKDSCLIYEVENATGHFVSKSNWMHLKNRVIKSITLYHRKQPLKTGIGKEELRSSLKPTPPESLFYDAISQLVSDNKIVEESNLLRLTDFSTSMNSEQEVILLKMHTQIKKAGADGLSQKDLFSNTLSDPRQAKAVFQYLIETRAIQRLPGSLFMDRDILDDIAIKLKDLFGTQKTLTVGEFRDAIGISRKQAVPLLEYFDSIGLTIRKGNVRVLRKTDN